MRAPDSEAGSVVPFLGPAVTPALSHRQLDALMAYARAGDQRRAADDLGISTNTLKAYLTETYLALDVTGAIDAFRAMGWLRIPEAA